MLFAALCYDKPGALDLRLATRAEHLAFLDKYAAQVKLGGPFLDKYAAQVKLGGPFLDDADKPVGSLLILDCVDETAARALLAEDPYAQAGLFERVELRRWKHVVGAKL